jgi:pyruvate/2-oxoglutarate dehydrogenase complex dihydrolipoamide dehydrogenase (E3) component/uncharacterized membrane protein YdjX (TVP38/TMEM64 family)
MKPIIARILTLTALVAAVSLFFAFDLSSYLTLDYIKQQQNAFARFYQAHAALTLLVYFLAYVLMAALSLPGAAVMTLAGGALFGLGPGLVVVSFASTIGATLAFWAARFLLRDTIQKRFGDKLAAVNAGIAKDGAFYLFTLRLVPVFPFFVINLVMGLTPIRTGVFYLVSQLGMLPGTLVYVNAGTRLAAVESVGDILSPALLVSFALLGIFPLAAKAAVALMQRRRVYARWPRPETFDYNLVVIGAGSAGLVASYIGAAVRAKVALIEKNQMGGDCLNTGCVPSKALIRSARMLAYARRANDFGFRDTRVEYTFAEVMERVQRVIRAVAPHDSEERYRQLGVDVIRGEARITSPFTVTVNDRTLTTRNIIVATGARPFVPAIAGLEEAGYLTSDTLWSLRELPGRLVVLGGGPIGCEMAQVFARLGSRVTQVEMAPRLMVREDADISRMIRERFEEEGIQVLTGYKAKAVLSRDVRKSLICESATGDLAVPFDAILVAVGRAANARGFGLEDLGVTLRPNGTIETNGLLQTNYPNIYCSGDVAGPYQFTHTAAHQSWYAAVNALFGRFKTFAVDYRVIPWATFTDPEVARVGLNVQEAREKKIPFEVTGYGLDELDRAIADSNAHGLIRVLTKPGTDQILGVTIVGSHAGELIAEYVLAMKQRIGLNKILGTIHIYPTLAEANKYAAGAWKRAHAPRRLLAWIEKYHAWMRG